MGCLEYVPKYGFGTAFKIGDDHDQIRPEDFKELVIRAVKLGCRHFDCAPLYKTQKLVGEALQTVIPSLVSRSELFITSKLPPNMVRGDNPERSIKQTLKELQLDYVDLFLIHAPFFTKHVTDDDFYPLSKGGNVLLDYDVNLLERTWLKLVELKNRGFTRFIGASNINIIQLNRLNEMNHVDIVQNEYHLFLQDRELFDHCEELNTHFEAYAAFGSPLRAKAESLPTFLDDKQVDRIAKLRNVSKIEVVIRWIESQPLSFVVRADTVEQLEENLNALDVENVQTDDLILLDALDETRRFYEFKEHAGLERHPEYPFKRT